VLTIADRVTVLRDGETVASGPRRTLRMRISSG
jgi:ABC-type sugar transport system ATPase subunit